MEVDRTLITSLIEFAMTADYTRVRRIGSQIAKRLAEENDLDGAKAIQSLLRKRGVPLQASGYAEALPRDAGSRLPLIEEGQWPTRPILLGGEVGHTITQFVEDAKHIELMAQKGVPRDSACYFTARPEPARPYSQATLPPPCTVPSISRGSTP